MVILNVNSSPVNYLAFDESCQVNGFLPSLQARFKAKRFWGKQLELLDEELTRPSYQEMMAQIEKDFAQVREKLHSPSAIELEAERLRKEASALLERAEAVEHPEFEAIRQRAFNSVEEERQQRHEVLRGCRAIIQARASLGAVAP